MKLIAITDRTLSSQNYWDHMEQIAATNVDGIILREKTLSEEDYTSYAKKMQRLCNCHQKFCILSHFGRIGIKLHIPRFQCSISYFQSHTSLSYYMTSLGVSVHTAEEARQAEDLGATYIIASHVLPTPCKPDLPPIGLDTLRDICSAVRIPVYAMGGITPETLPQLQGIPIAGVCVMTGIMTCEDVPAYVRQLRQAMKKTKEAVRS